MTYSPDLGLVEGYENLSVFASIFGLNNKDLGSHKSIEDVLNIQSQIKVVVLLQLINLI